MWHMSVHLIRVRQYTSTLNCEAGNASSISFSWLAVRLCVDGFVQWPLLTSFSGPII